MVVRKLNPVLRSSTPFYSRHITHALSLVEFLVAHPLVATNIRGKAVSYRALHVASTTAIPRSLGHRILRSFTKISREPGNGNMLGEEWPKSREASASDGELRFSTRPDGALK